MSQIEIEETEHDFELGRDGPKVVVVGLDPSQVRGEGSHASLYAAAYAAGLARRQNGRVVAVWVRPRAAIADTFVETVDEIAQEREHAADDVRAIVEEAAAHFDVPAASLQVREGDPFDELCAAAEEVQTDAVVVGASTHRLGSLATRLIRAGRWPVTVVPQPSRRGGLDG